MARRFDRGIAVPASEGDGLSLVEKGWERPVNTRQLPDFYRRLLGNILSGVLRHFIDYG